MPFQRHLPHLYVIGQPLFATFGLHGCLPAGRNFPRESMTSGQAFVCMDRLLDGARTGPLHLRMPDIARQVADAIERGHGTDYDLHSWVIMPNHVHLLITPHTDVSRSLQCLKRAGAREANRFLNRTGPFWQQESYDRLVRDAHEFRHIASYILWNPIRAGLARTPDEYPWWGRLYPAAGFSPPTRLSQSG